MKSLGPVSKQRGYLLAVSQSGVYFPVDSIELEAEYNLSIKWAWTVAAAGWVSAALFAIGAICVGLAMANAPTAEGIGRERQNSSQVSVS